MICQVCHNFLTTGLLCEPCSRQLRRAPDRLVDGTIRLVAAFEHVGSARILAHHLKYRGLVGYAHYVAQILAPRLPRAPLVPVPRSWSRRLVYGLDPALVLAESLARILDVPVRRLLIAPIHSRRRAGGDHSIPVRPYRARGPLDSGVLVIDDVVTTGATMKAAIAALGRENVLGAVSANAANGVSSLRLGAPIRDRTFPKSGP
jgi:predicted amidophosphoribosyltransferase